MPAIGAMLKPTEAAVVARVTVRDVNRAIDERILPDSFISLERGRRVTATACSLISFYFMSARRLTSEERLLAIREVGRRLDQSRASAEAPDVEDWTVRDEFLTIDLAPFVQQTRERLQLLSAAEARVVSDPEILGGLPVLRGTRVPVHDVAASVTAGIPTDRLLSAYPTLDHAAIELAAIYAAANPARGRPREAQPHGGNVMSERRVPRRVQAG